MLEDLLLCQASLQDRGIVIQWENATIKTEFQTVNVLTQYGVWSMEQGKKYLAAL